MKHGITRLAGLVVCLFIGRCVAGELSEERTKAFLEQASDAHKARLSKVESDIEKYQDHLKRAKKGTIDLKQKQKFHVLDKDTKKERGVFNSKAAKEEMIARDEAALKSLSDELKELKESKYVIPKLDADSIAVGNMGLLIYPQNVVNRAGKPCEATIEQIIDGETALIKAYGQLFWLQIKTSGMVDGKAIVLDFPVDVTGTKKYATAGGSSNTVFILKRFDVPKEFTEKPVAASK